ncbi:MAG: anthranilate phosphoribosyltransferase, partial [Leptospiraceae bacterium]|nr:anthranilate phosphoribosyltransferase [Leptospiraceae bacterium]
MNLLEQLTQKENLSFAQSRDFMLEVMRGEVSEIVLASFLTALKMKEETEEELAGFVTAIRESAVPTAKDFSFDFIDTCGTGGDSKASINISTLSAITIASMGVKVAKHGNRSVSSVCGSSDLLEGLGYPFPKTVSEAIQRFEEHGFVFLFAPFWHPAMKHAANVRKQLGFRTVFNMIGPLSNPFHPTHKVV